MAYFHDSALSSFSGFAPRIVYWSLLNNPPPAAKRFWLMWEKPYELPVCCLSVERVELELKKSPLKKKKRSWIHLVVMWGFKFVVKAMRLQGCCLFTSDCQQWQIKLVPVPRINWTPALIYALIAIACVGSVWASWSKVYFQQRIGWQVLTWQMQDDKGNDLKWEVLG